MECPCGTGLPFAECCGPLLDGTRNPPTAEALMRSRYSAFVRKNVAYLVQTHDPRTRHDVDVDATEAWADRTEWLSLEVLRVVGGRPDDAKGEVEFIARYREADGREAAHREHSRFVRHEGRWYYEGGAVRAVQSAIRTEPRIGRNDPCPCGSGKKHKKCCGAPERRAP